MNYPKVKFKINKELDKKTAWQFLNVKEAGIDFGKSILAVHPELSKINTLKNKKDKKEYINKYFDGYYKKYGKMLANDLIIVEKEWCLIKNEFFEVVDQIFYDYPWPKGRYIGYMSTLNCNVVFWKNKEWQVFAWLPDKYREIIVHEMLHFIFVDYFFKKIKNKKLREQWWTIAEVFNTVIINTPAFKKLIKPGKELGYPEHRILAAKMKKEWKKTKNIDQWIKKFSIVVKE